ncbi:iron-containing alcohol dehydrogenase family protein [Virgibacillus necropolis]|uniref:Alcohol dehydrogenase n=1 Tax=Virgibacillus necropolis TaxID=163877 RepID=A0A221MEK0_9BACI|nr:iron-containing alcohol dehydrogenase [Virgibacillus necropolis]ASN06106.1 alcohol dehydrogenase [Virgibacillus necropolis]
MATLSLPNQIEIGAGCINQLGKIISASGASKPLIIMDAFLAQAPVSLQEKVQRILQQEQLEFELFSDYAGEPTVDHVQAALHSLASSHADCVVAIGGGSAIDISKAVSLFGLNPEMKWSNIVSQSRLKRLPLIAIPTTAGTGSEATGIMVITDIKAGVKMNPGHPHLIPDTAILDPELTVSLPQHFTAFTGLDALTHAIEAYVSNRSSAMTDLYALKAIRMIGEALPKVYEDGSNVKERENMILASCYAGIAFFNSSTNLAHAAGRALGTRFHIPHGLSVALLLPYVMQFGIKDAEDRYQEIAIALGEDSSKEPSELAQSSIDFIENFNEQFGIWDAAQKYIKNIDLLSESMPILIEDALSGNGITTNRKVPSYSDIEKIFVSLSDRISKVKIND